MNPARLSPRSMDRMTKYAALAAAAALISAIPALADAKSKPKYKKVLAGEDLPTGAGPRMDIVFVIDSTGSMGGEIGTVKAEVKSMVGEILAGDPRPDVRFGVVDYRDKGDVFRVRTLEMTRAFDSVYSFIDTIAASGGGDGPESVNKGLETAVDKMSWDEDKNTAKMVFLLGDAPGHAYPGEKHYTAIAKTAKKEGIIINTVACRDWDEMITQWKEIAKLTGGEFSRLKYRDVVVDAKGKSKTVITDGTETLVAEGEMSDDDWGKDIETLKKEKKLRSAKPGEFAGTASSSSYGYGRGSGAMAGAAADAAPAAAPAPYSIGRDKSDVGKRMLETVKRAAKKKGVSYK